MKRISVAITAIAVLLGTATSYAQQSYNLPQGAKVTDAPCEAWQRNPDGSWVQTGSIRVGGVTYRGNIFKGTGETAVLEVKCKKN